MKKLLCLILTFALIFSLSLSAFADWTYAVPQAEPSEKFYDYAGLVSTTDEQRLREELQILCGETGLDVAAVITADNAGLTSAEYADDFYDYNGFAEDGLLLLINMEDREVWISTCGKAISYFTDGVIDDMTYELVEPLGDGDYSGAVSLFIQQVNETMSRPPAQGITTSQNESPRPVQSNSSTNTAQRQEERMLSVLSTAALGSAAFGGIVVAVMAALHNRLPNKTKTTMNYVTGGRVHLTNSRDIFLNSSVRRVRLQNDSPSRGGGGGGHSHSSVHRSSSGRSHGGGGRKF